MQCVSSNSRVICSDRSQSHTAHLLLRNNPWFFFFFVKFSLCLRMICIVSSRCFFFYWKKCDKKTTLDCGRITRCGPHFGHNRRSGAVPHESNRMEHSNSQKREKHTLSWGGGRISSSYRQVTHKIPKTVKSLVVLQFWLISTRWDENKTRFVFSACYETHWNWFCRRKQNKKCQDQKRSIFLAKGVW